MKNLFVLAFLSLISFSAQGQTAEEYLVKAKDKIGLGDHMGAIADFNKAIELDPTNWLSYSGRGIAKGNLGDHRGAIAALQ